jgi:hypothetical protein
VENLTLAGPGPVAVSDGPGDYADDMECIWNINSSGPITIVFKAFSTEADCDFLKVFDGTSGDVLGNFSGETLPEILSTNATSLRVVFTSDSSSSSVGFALEAFALVPGGTWAPTGAPTALPTWAPDTTGAAITRHDPVHYDRSHVMCTQHQTLPHLCAHLGARAAQRRCGRT